MILLQPENDLYVMPEAQYKFAEGACNCEIIKIKGSKHESFNEDDDISFAIFAKILEFFNANCI